MNPPALQLGACFAKVVVPLKAVPKWVVGWTGGLSGHVISAGNPTPGVLWRGVPEPRTSVPHDASISDALPHSKVGTSSPAALQKSRKQLAHSPQRPLRVSSSLLARLYRGYLQPTAFCQPCSATCFRGLRAAWCCPCEGS